MRHRCLVAVFAVIAVVALTPPFAAAQSAEPPRTPWGDPDLQGTWTNTTTTPLERPDGLEGKELLTEEERAKRNPESGLSTESQSATRPTGAYNDYWLEKGELSLRTSLIVDPANGKLPPLTPKAAMRRAENAGAGGRGPDGPEDRNSYERCISRALPGAMMPGFYNHNYQIFQTPGYLVILVEMIHDARVIPLDGRPHVGVS